MDRLPLVTGLTFSEPLETGQVVLEFASPIPLQQLTELTILLAPACASGTLPPIRMSYTAKGLSGWIDLGKPDQ